MQHLNEHTLAFYAMDAESAAREKDAIEAHLRECHGCRAQLEELRGINQHFLTATDSGATFNDSTSEALVAFPRAIRRRRDPRPVQFEGWLPTRASKFVALVRNHPIGTGSAALICALLGIFLIQGITSRGEVVLQPSFIKVDDQGMFLEVWGDTSKLWIIPLTGRYASEFTRESYRDDHTRIVDLDGDGNVEVITGAPYRQGEKEFWDRLRIFDSGGRLLSSWSLGSTVTYNGVPYANSFTIHGVAIISEAGSVQKEIVVGLCNDRSPSFVVRLDLTGKRLGEYWHFGWMQGPKLVPLEGGEDDWIVIYGVNDANYQADSSHPELTILDVSRIVGQTEAVQTRGFGYHPSQAEIYTVTPGFMNSALLAEDTVHHGSYITRKSAPDSSFVVHCKYFLPQDFPLIMYTFDKTMSVSVWFDDLARIQLTTKFLVNKTAAGLVAFRKDLESRVRYWDGTEWKREPVKISHAGSLSVPTLP